MADKSLSTIAKELYQGFGRNPANRELADTLTFRAPVVKEFNPTYFIPRGINTLRNADYGALKSLIMRDYMKSATPREDIGRGVGALGDVVMGGLDASPLTMLASPAKAGVKYAARELGPVANRRMEQAMDDLGLRLNVVKPEGGQWSDSSRNLIGKTFKERSEARYAPEVSNWLQTAGKKYVLNRMGSPNDELRMLLDKEMSHLDTGKLREMATELSQTEKDLIRAKRKSQGFPEEGMAESQAAKRFELMTDEFINPNPAYIYQQDARFTPDAPWSTKLDPDTPIYSKERGVSYLFDQAGFPEMSQALERAIKSGDLRAEQLNKVSVADAAKLAHDYRVADEAAALSELPKLREYPEGYSWQELTNEDPAVLDKILKREGEVMQNCIGGYCSDVIDDGTRLFSLRDPAGNPHVNIEVTPGQRAATQDFLKNIIPEEEIAAMSDAELMSVFKENFPELGKRLTPDSFNPKIRQIKGKQNEAPIEDYLPYVQDFVLNPVTSNPYSRVNDLENTGLIDLNRLREHGLFDLSSTGARGREINAELNRIYPAELDQFGGRTLSGQYGVRIPTFDMMRGVVQEMPGNYASPSSLIEYLRGIEPRPIEHGYSKYWNDVENANSKRIVQEAAENPDHPANFAEGGAVDFDHPEPDEAYEFRDFGLRQTGEPKEEGALGLIRMPDGMTDMTEYSINVDGKEMPSIIEGMHPADINYIRETGDVPEDAVRTAIHNARKREAQGKNAFYNRKEDRGYAKGGKVNLTKAEIQKIANKYFKSDAGFAKRVPDIYEDLEANVKIKPSKYGMNITSMPGNYVLGVDPSIIRTGQMSPSDVAVTTTSRNPFAKPVQDMLFNVSRGDQALPTLAHESSHAWDATNRPWLKKRGLSEKEASNAAQRYMQVAPKLREAGDIYADYTFDKQPEENEVVAKLRAYESLLPAGAKIFQTQLGKQVFPTDESKAWWLSRTQPSMSDQNYIEWATKQAKEGKGYAEGGLVYNGDDVDYDEMYEFR